MQRTQIYLPEELRKDIDRFRRESRESVAGYIRSAAKARVEKEKKRKADLKKIAEEIGGSIDLKESGWAGIDIDKWQREIRKDRKII